MKKQGRIDSKLFSAPYKTGTKGEMMRMGIRGIIWLRFQGPEDRRLVEDLLTALEIKCSRASDEVIGIFDSTRLAGGPRSVVRRGGRR